MRQCPRCRSSMIVTRVDTREGIGQVWYCLGCGRELLLDPRAQAEDDSARERIRAHGVGRGVLDYPVCEASGAGGARHAVTTRDAHGTRSRPK